MCRHVISWWNAVVYVMSGTNWLTMMCFGEDGATPQVLYILRTSQNIMTTSCWITNVFISSGRSAETWLKIGMQQVMSSLHPSSVDSVVKSRWLCYLVKLHLIGAIRCTWHGKILTYFTYDDITCCWILTDTNPIPDPNQYRRRCPDHIARIQKFIHYLATTYCPN